MIRSKDQQENYAGHQPFPELGSVCVTQPLFRIIILRLPGHPKIKIRIRHQTRHASDGSGKHNVHIPEDTRHNVRNAQYDLYK